MSEEGGMAQAREEKNEKKKANAVYTDITSSLCACNLCMCVCVYVYVCCAALSRCGNRKGENKRLKTVREEEEKFLSLFPSATYSHKHTHTHTHTDTHAHTHTHVYTYTE